MCAEPREHQRNRITAKPGILALALGEFGVCLCIDSERCEVFQSNSNMNNRAAGTV